MRRATQAPKERGRRQCFPLQAGLEAITSATFTSTLPPSPSTTPPTSYSAEALLGQEGRLTRELLLELPDQSCCLLLLLCLLKPLALELR